jgi:tetratricopeptide (TPR) repeat protein
MKYWADGNNANGLKTNEGLTDSDGRYIELMAGFYTDNQPDYSWLQPYETKIGKMIWFPIRDLGGLKFANRNGALNYFITGTTLDLRLNTTTSHKQAKVVVNAGGKRVFEKTISISPSSPGKLTCLLPAGTKENDLDLALYDAQGKILLSYQPQPQPEYDKPKPVEPFPAPEEMKSVEELYLAGLRLDQFYNASVDPMSYYMEALKRDPGNYNVNTQLGIKAIKAYDWKSAEKYLRTAVERITARYTRPKDGEALYYLGLTLRALGQDEEAYEMFYRASWSYAWHTASYFQLASMDCMSKQYLTALEHLDLSISTNTDNMRAINLKAYVLRQLNRLDEAGKLLQQSLDTCKIDYMASNELINIAKAKNQPFDDKLKELNRQMIDDVQLYLELAFEYAQFGAYTDANAVLERLVQEGNTFPMVYYTMGYFNKLLSNNDKALADYQKAASMPTDYCYPFRLEEVTILNDAMSVNPSDARAPYYLGNLLFEEQPDAAIALWQKSLTLDKNFYIPYRNLAWAYKTVKQDYAKALDYIHQASAHNNKDARLLYEVDDLNDLNKLSPKQKYDFLKKNMAVAKTRSEVILSLATRAVEYGKYEEAIRLMDDNFIIESEGARVKQDNYLNSYCILAMTYANKGQYEKAIKQINKALDYPIGLYGRSVYARLYYIAGSIYQKKGDANLAKEYYQKASEVVAGRGTDNEYNYYKAMSLKALGKDDAGNAMLKEMLDNINQTGSAFFSQFGGADRNRDRRLANNHYYTGLAYMGLGDNAKASAEFTKALEYNPSHVLSQWFSRK